MISPPKAILYALVCLWSSLMLSPLKIIIDHEYFDDVNSLRNLLVSLVVGVGVSAGVTYGILKQKRWVKRIYVVITLLGVPASYPIVSGEFERSLMLGSVSVVQILLQLTSITLLSLPQCAEWFGRPRKAG